MSHIAAPTIIERSTKSEYTHPGVSVSTEPGQFQLQMNDSKFRILNQSKEHPVKHIMLELWKFDDLVRFFKKNRKGILETIHTLVKRGVQRLEQSGDHSDHIDQTDHLRLSANKDMPPRP